MEILGHTISPKVKKFINQQEQIIGSRIKFCDLACHQNKIIRTYAGAYDFIKPNHIVWLNPEGKDFESTLLHELTHAVLYYQRYPAIKFRKDNKLNDRLSHLGGILYSVVLDPIIDSRLKKDGMPLRKGNKKKLYNAIDIESKKLEEFHSQQKHGWEAYYICYWSLTFFGILKGKSFTDDKKKEIGSFLEEKINRAFENGHELAKGIILNDMTTPEEARDAMLKLRNFFLPWTEYIIVEIEKHTP